MGRLWAQLSPGHAVLSPTGKVKKELDPDDGHLHLDETTKLLQDLHEAQAERGGSRPSSNLSSLSNASEREPHPPGRWPGHRLGPGLPLPLCPRASVGAAERVPQCYGGPWLCALVQLSLRVPLPSGVTLFWGTQGAFLLGRVQRHLGGAPLQWHVGLAQAHPAVRSDSLLLGWGQSPGPPC